MKDLSIIIVSWNVADLLAACLNSVQQAMRRSDAPDTEVIVVDSASNDQTVAMIEENYPWVCLLPQTENVGFTRGNNIGLEIAEGRHLLLLNPDTEIHNDALAQMVRYLDAHPSVGLVGPHTLNSDGSTQSSRRRFPNRTTAFFESTWLQPLAPGRLLDWYYVTDAPDEATLPVDWVQGSAVMARREVYEAIGGLDALYTMFFEETDWCKRAKDAGWQVVYLGSAKIVHHGGKSTDQIGAQKHIYFQESKLRYYRQHEGATFAFILRLFLLLNYAWQLILEAAKGFVGHKRDLRRDRVKTYWRVLRSGLKAT